MECLEIVHGLASKSGLLIPKGCGPLLQPVPLCLPKTVSVDSKSIFSVCLKHMLPASCLCSCWSLCLDPLSSPSPPNLHSPFKSQQQFCLNHVDFAVFLPFPNWTRNKDSFVCVPTYFILCIPSYPLKKSSSDLSLAAEENIQIFHLGPAKPYLAAPPRFSN